MKQLDTKALESVVGGSGKYKAPKGHHPKSSKGKH